MGKFKEIYNRIQNEPYTNRNFSFMVYKNQKKVKSRFGGDMYYLFFNDGEKSFRTCVDTTFRNFKKWERLIKNAKAGDMVTGLIKKGKGLVDADSNPKWIGNIYD
tara:strand:+ start:1052 stop:1366 length:315 start_codon:yes stop_codon:yes gene_type:complete